jgi:hypothetical protein
MQFGLNLERFLIDLNRGGFPLWWKSDSKCWLGLEAGMNGQTAFDGFTVARSGCD